MQNSWKRLLVVAVAAAALSVMGGARSTARAEEHKPNACGCYQNVAGVCICGRPSKCGCPEECEPKGCAEKRQKELDKEIQAETKKAEEADKKRREEAAAKAKAAEAKAAVAKPRAAVKQAPTKVPTKARSVTPPRRPTKETTS